MQSARLELVGTRFPPPEHCSDKRFGQEETTLPRELQLHEVRIWMVEGQIRDCRGRGARAMLFVWFSATCQVTVQVNTYESHSETSHKTCSEINTTQGYGTPEKDLAVLCLLLIRKSCSVFISKVGLLTITVSCSGERRCGFSSKNRDNWDYLPFSSENYPRS